MAINYGQIESAIKKIGKTTNNRKFLRLFLDAYGFPKSTFSRLSWPTSSTYAGIYVQNKLYFVDTNSPSLFADFDIYKRNGLNRLHANFLIIANKVDILACDLNSLDVINVRKADLYKSIEFFFPLLGTQNTTVPLINESVDIKVAEKFAQLYNEISLQNSGNENLASQFVCQLLFCCFMESVGHLTDSGLISLISTYTEEDGSDCPAFFNDLFFSLRSTARDTLPAIFEKVHYIDARLFPVALPCFKVTSSARRLILEILQLDWKAVTPEILGALIQAIVIPTSRSICGNYTATANIQKLIGPLYMNELYRVYGAAEDMDQLMALQKRIREITIFDPACGAGNFLLVAYKELYKLESLIRAKLMDLGVDITSLPGISPSQFFGIEERAFSWEVAKLGFLFSVYQQTESIKAALEAYFSNNLVQGDPLQIDWQAICDSHAETYIVGNPSYRGANRQSPIQKRNLQHVFYEYKKCSNLDYAACWFLQAAKYMKFRPGGFAFVTTNSLTQGNQVRLLWPKLYDLGFYIQFAHTSFKWKNDARNRTAVTVVIIGMMHQNQRLSTCELYLPHTTKEVAAISPYLVPGNAIIGEKSSSICGLPTMVKGNMPYDNGLLLFSPQEKHAFVEEYPESRKYFRHVVGSEEFINGKERWCLWIHGDEADAALQIPGIRERVNRLKKWRLDNPDKNVRKIANRAYQFRDIKETHSISLVIPAVFSENYLYPPAGFVFKDTIVTNLASVIYDCEPWVFGVITSQMHNAWIRTVCGKLEERIRYSLKLGYNTFPIPPLNSEQKRLIEKCVFNIVRVRETHSGETLASLYHKDRMPEDLRLAHNMLDEVIDKCYRNDPFLTNEDRLTTLFDLYERAEA